MRKHAFFWAAAALLIQACTRAGEIEASPPQRVELEKIARGVWLHKSYKTIEPWGSVLSHGLVFDSDKGVVLIDTAWNDAQTTALLSLIEDMTGELPAVAIITHAHDDKMGGVGALKAAGVETMAHRLTNEDAPARGLIPADVAFDLAEGRQLTFKRGEDFRLFYPGPGHTRDNIVVYETQSRILFGGCLVRPLKQTSLGNTSDGDIAHWDDAVAAVARAFPDAKIVIPSHGAPGGRALLDHTIAVAREAQ